MSNLLEKFLSKQNGNHSSSTVSKIISNNKDSNIFSTLISHSDQYASSKDNGNLNQYFNIYNNRLAYFKSRIIKETRNTFGSELEPTTKVLDIQPTVLSQFIKHDQPKETIKSSALTFAVGTIYTEMKYKPDILNQVSKDIYGMPEAPSHYTLQSEEDKADSSQNSEVLLEDESGRIVLKFDHINAPKDILVTGVVVGIRGYVDIDNCLQVLDCCYPEALPSQDVDLESDDDSKVLIVSGLNINKETNLQLVQKLQEFLAGASTAGYTNNVIFLGDSLTNYSNLSILSDLVSTTIKSNSLTLIPSFNDPSDKTLPQRPINMKLFDRKIQINSPSLICSETNPLYLEKYQAVLESGDSINDIVKYGDYDDIESRTSILKGFVKWQNLVPTAPDTLNIMPYNIDEQKDPFVMKDSYPRSLIVGNQPEFINVNFNGVQLIGIPIFSKTQQIVQLDLKTLDYKLIQIEV